ncbi:MAG: hypothetical protein ACOY93_17510 [Bacillota bacterium]
MEAIVVGLGEFGAQVTAHLEARGPRGLRLLTCTGTVPTRRAGADLLRQRWPELVPSEGVGAGASLHLVAAAEEAGGGGMLTAALSLLEGRQPCQVWLVLPGAQADTSARARAFATLAELEALRAGGLRLEGWLHQARGPLPEVPQRLGDALLYRTGRPGSAPAADAPPYRGVGFGVVRDPAAAVRRRLAHQIAVRLVEEYLRQPDPAHLLPRMREAVQRAVRALFLPVDETPVFAHRWNALQPETPDLSSLLDFYEPEGEWHRQAAAFWEERVSEARRGLAAALGHAWRSGFEVVHEEARAALTLAHEALEAEIQRTESAVGGYQERFERALAAAEAGEIQLAELDAQVAAYLLESMRLGALERLALAMDGVVELVMDGLWGKANQVRALLQEVQAHRPRGAALRLAHALSILPSAEQERAWLDEIQPRLARALLHGTESLSAEGLLETAHKDVDRYLRTRNPALHLPRGHRQREAWLDALTPGLRLAEDPPCTCEVSSDLPGDYQEDLRSRGLQVEVRSTAWFSGEWAVYIETPPFALKALSDLPAWAGAYRAAPAPVREGLHVLPEPPGGWALAGLP